MLLGVKITLSAGSTSQSTFTDADGSFAFENLEGGTADRVTAQLSGFATVNRELAALVSGEAMRADFRMSVNWCGGIVDFAEPSLDDRFLMASALLHVRTGDVVREPK